MATTTDSGNSAQAEEVADVLAGRRSYDDIDERSQTVVRAHWSQRIDAELKRLDLGAEFIARGETYAEFADGKVVLR